DRGHGSGGGCAPRCGPGGVSGTGADRLPAGGPVAAPEPEYPYPGGAGAIGADAPCAGGAWLSGDPQWPALQCRWFSAAGPTGCVAGIFQAMPAELPGV